MRQYFLITLLLASFFASGQNVDLLPTSVMPLDTASWTLLRQPLATSLRKVSLNRIFLTGKNYYDALYWKTYDTTTLQSDVILQGQGYNLSFRNQAAINFDTISGFNYSMFDGVRYNTRLTDVDGVTENIYGQVLGNDLTAQFTKSNSALGVTATNNFNSTFGTNSFGSIFDQSSGYSNNSFIKVRSRHFSTAGSLNGESAYQVILRKTTDDTNYTDAILNFGEDNQGGGVRGFNIYYSPSNTTTNANVGAGITSGEKIFGVDIPTGTINIAQASAASSGHEILLRTNGSGTQPVTKLGIGSGLAISGTDLVSTGGGTGSSTNGASSEFLNPGATGATAHSQVILSSTDISNGQTVRFVVEWVAKLESGAGASGGSYAATWEKNSGTLTLVGQTEYNTHDNQTGSFAVTTTDTSGNITLNITGTGVGNNKIVSKVSFIKVL